MADKKPNINPFEEQRISLPWMVIEPQTEGYVKPDMRGL